MISITWHGVEQFNAAIDELAAKFGDLRFMWPRIAARFYAIETEQFRSQGRATPWAPLTAGYSRWKETHYPGRPILQRFGNLMRSLTSREAPGAIYDEQPQHLTIGSNDPTAALMQFGTRYMVARPPIDLTAADIDSFGQIAAQEGEQLATRLGFRTATLG